jgi:signal transduction histidine kinase
MSISLVFSGIIYRITTKELERSFKGVQQRFWEDEEFGPFLGFSRRMERLRPLFTKGLEQAKRRIIWRLVAINGAIFVFSAAAGWFLAGKTLKPIEQAMEEQKRFVADASHELRTPLAALKTSNEVALRDKNLTFNEAKKVIKSNLEEIENLETLTNNLLTLASLEENGQKLIFKKVNIKKIITSAYQKILPLALKKKIKIKIESNGGEVFGNEESLEKMILIFLDNAIKYTPEWGKVWLKTRQEKGKLVLEVKDTGIGISKTDLPHIFERFYRADKVRKKGGFGLGLALAKRIIELHRGSVRVASQLGKGATFTVKLPLTTS